MELEMAPTQETVMTARADLVAILEELHDVLVRIDDGTVDRRYTDFAALAKRLEECIEKVQELPNGSMGSQPTDEYHGASMHGSQAEIPRGEGQACRGS